MQGRDAREPSAGLLAGDEPPPLAVENAEAASGVVIVCEHAGRRIPRALGALGLPEARLARHYMWDIGALDLARALAARLEAPLLHQRYSRMVCDCNRRPDVASFIPPAGEGEDVPGNREIRAAERMAREAAIWRPFHDGVAAFLEARGGRPTAFVTIHSFTPVFFGEARPWLAGVLYDRDRRLAPATLAALREIHGERVGENEPYRMSREDDYTVPVHGEDRGLPSVEIEVRNDLLQTAAGVEVWADTLAAALRPSVAAALGSSE